MADLGSSGFHRGSITDMEKAIHSRVPCGQSWVPKPKSAYFLSPWCYEGTQLAAFIPSQHSSPVPLLSRVVRLCAELR